MQSAGPKSTPSGPWAWGWRLWDASWLGLLMGLGVGCMAVGAVFLALSLRYQP